MTWTVLPLPHAPSKSSALSSTGKYFTFILPDIGRQMTCKSCHLFKPFWLPFLRICRSRWPCGLRRRSAVAWLLRWRFWILLTAWCLSLVFVVCSVGSSRCDELTAHSVAPYRLRVCDLETSTTRRHRPELGCCTTKENYKNFEWWSKAYVRISS